MDVGGKQQPGKDLLGVVDLPDGGDGKGAVMGADDQRLRLVVGNASDSEIALHLIGFPVKFCPERRVFYIVDGAVEAVIPAVYGHARPAGSQMGMVVRPEEKIEYAVFL